MSERSIRINGERIYLRRVTLDNVNETYVDWLNDPEVNQYLETRYQVQTLDSVREYVEGMAGKEDELFLAIHLKDKDRHIGNIKLGPVNPIHTFADVSLFIGEKSCWGKGIATEAISVLANCAFSVLELNKLRAGCYSENKGSARAFLKSGFEQEGRLRNQWIMNEKYQDELLFGYWVEDWRSSCG